MLASITSSITTLIGDHGLYAIFLLMVIAAVLPAASELTMLYAGALAAGAFEGAHVIAFGHEIQSQGAAYVAVSLAGLAGNLVGAALGWTIGRYAEVGLERRGKLLHVTPARLARAERWFSRFGRIAVPVGFVTPGVRSFVAIPAGIGRVPFGRFIAFASVGCAAFCFGLAAVGWAVGSNYSSVRRYLDYAVVAGIVVLIGLVVVRRRSSRLRRRAPDSAG
jgi:membrane protein DedA with SNARE-associated domain